MKKILFLIPNLAHGGAEKALVNLANNLEKEKYDITVQTLFDNGVNRQYLQKHVHYIPGIKYEFRGYSQLQKLLSPKRLYSLLVKENYDILISFLEGSTTRIISGANSTCVKTISWVHTEMLDSMQFSRCFRTLKEAQNAYASMTKVVAVSRQVKKSLSYFIESPCEPITLYNVNETENILEKSVLEPLDFNPQNTFTICSIGKITSVKGYDRLLNVHKRLIDENLFHNIYIIGIGEDQKKLEIKARELGVDNSFHMIGYRDNPYQYVARCDLYVCSSRREGFSTAATEALVIGTPVVSTDCSGAKELLGEHNEYGLVVDNSEEGIYEGIKRMLSEPELLANYKKKTALRGQCFSKNETVKAAEMMLDSL